MLISYKALKSTKLLQSKELYVFYSKLMFVLRSAILTVKCDYAHRNTSIQIFLKLSVQFSKKSMVYPKN